MNTFYILSFIQDITGPTVINVGNPVVTYILFSSLHLEEGEGERNKHFKLWVATDDKV